MRLRLREAAEDQAVHVFAGNLRDLLFVKDPRDIVKPGDVVRVKVLDVDVPRKRISLTLRLDDDIDGDTGDRRTTAPQSEPSRGAGKGNPQGKRSGRSKGGQQGKQRGAPAQGAMADALRRAGLSDH